MLKQTGLFIFFLSCSFCAWCQSGWLHTDNDSAYIEDHTKDLTMRLYGSRKYTLYDVKDRTYDRELKYRPNSNFNIGVGANYKFLGLNIGFKLPFINNDNKTYGKTSLLDLQSHIYLRKLVIDFYGQYYKGYYLENPHVAMPGYPAEDIYSLRPDLYSLDIGLNMQYIFNDKRFSYRSAYLQNEYQKKSAGSFLVGWEAFAVKVHGDSAIIPPSLGAKGFWGGSDFNHTGILSVAVNGGYAYTYVYKKHFFGTVSVVGAIGINRSKLTYPDERPDDHKTGLELNNTVRLSIGYNSNRYFAGIHYVNMLTSSTAPVTDGTQKFGAGNFRVSIVRRFTLKKKLF